MRTPHERIIQQADEAMRAIVFRAEWADDPTVDALTFLAQSYAVVALETYADNPDMAYMFAVAAAHVGHVIQQANAARHN